MFVYYAEVVRVVSANTLDLDVDLGLETHRRIRVRLASLDAPEPKAEGGEAAKEFVEEWVETHDPDEGFIVQTTQDRKEKYGRYLAVIYSGGACLNYDLVAAGHAVGEEDGPSGNRPVVSAPPAAEAASADL